MKIDNRKSSQAYRYWNFNFKQSSGSVLSKNLASEINLNAWYENITPSGEWLAVKINWFSQVALESGF